MNGGRIWLLIGGVIGIAIIALGWFVGASPLFTQADTSDRQRADVEATNQQLEVTLAGMKKLDEQKDELIGRLEQLRKTVPTVPNLEDYLDWVASAAATSAVSLPSATVGAPQLITVADGATVDLSEGLKKSLYVVPVSLNIGGNADQMNAFVELLQTDGRLQLIDEVGLNFGTSLSGKVDGYIFIVYDPSTGPLPASDPDGSGSNTGGAEGSPDSGPTPTPPADDPGA